MPKIYIKTPFTLTHDDGAKVHFVVGEQEVDQALVDHWYVKAHAGEKPVAGASASAEGAPAGPTEADGLAEQRAALDAAAQALASREQQLDQRTADLAARDAALAERERAVADREDAADERDVTLLNREKAIAEREQAAEKATAEAPKASKQSK